MTRTADDEKPILVASGDAAQVAAIRAALGSAYAVVQTADAAELRARAARCRLLLLDAAFTNDVVSALVPDMAGAVTVPVVVLTAADDVAGAAAALGAGAFNFVAKVAGYEGLLDAVVRDALVSVAERAAMADSIATLQARVVELERSREVAPRATPAADHEQGRRGMVLRVAARLRSGEVNLPACPEIHLRLRRLVEGGAGVHDVATLLAGDPGVAAGLLRMANSPYFRGARPTATLEEAIGRLGIATARSHVELIAHRSLYMTRRPNHRARLARLWRHAVATAHGAELTGRALGLDDAGLATAGLLHDVGRLLLVQLVSEIEVEQEAPMDGGELDALLDQHHTDFGIALLRRWSFPETMCHLIGQHERPDPTKPEDREALVVHFADRLAAHLGHGAAERAHADEAELAAAATQLALDSDAIDVIRTSVPAFVETCDAALGPAPGAA